MRLWLQAFGPAELADVVWWTGLGVGKVQARRIMVELDISESRRLRGLGRNQREGLLAHPKIVRPA